MSYRVASVDQAIELLQAGRMIMLLDDENRENEGDLVIAAKFATPEAINFMASFAKGLICLPMAESIVKRLRLPLMTYNNGSPYRTAFTVSIEAAVGVSTGISAKDRARTIEVAVNPNSTSDDIVSPGHMFPLMAKPNGVLERPGQTEGSVDLMKLANLEPAAVICEIMNHDGSMSRLDELIAFSDKHNIPIVFIKDLIDYRIIRENLVQEIASSTLPFAKYGDFKMTVFSNKLDNAEHFALLKKPQYTNQLPLVRIHSECITGDVFGSCKCDCGEQLQQSLKLISEQGGVLIYLRQEGRGLGLGNKLKAYALQEQGYDTVEANLQLGLPADARNYAIAFQILKFFKIEALRLLTNNPHKIAALEQYGLKILERISLITVPNASNRHYLTTKQQKLGHFL